MNKLIALDADGVLLNYGTAYADAWYQAFGVRPQLVNPNAYWPRERWGLPLLEGAELEHLRSQFDSSFWSSVPAIDGAREACLELRSAGYRLVVVSALPQDHAQDRLINLLSHGFPVDDVVATPRLDDDSVSPKAEALARLQPVAFVDDFLPYLRGLSRAGMHTALITRETDGTPNTGHEMTTLVDSAHQDLAGFVQWWLAGNR